MSLQLRVATFNIRNSSAPDGENAWPVRREATADAIAALDAEVVGLQEVLPDQLEYLRERFAGWEIVGAGRDDGVSAGEHSAVMVKSGAWRIESHETRWLSAEPAVPGSVGWDADLTRIATLVRLVHRDGVRIGVANAHYDHVGEQARVESSRLLDRWMSAEPDLHWIAMGDLNSEPGSAPLRALTEAGWIDAIPAEAGGTEHEFTGATDHHRIDHILLSKTWEILEAAVSHHRPGGRLPSDHWPVAATLQLP
ncbi:endonuclease/exonuclease/phosphatase family metal-dependent hydrolase [Kribbella amoyensis]|uniref:Endonuclease/exonuclease/phosphatase family metal-dependent hydrolase n=1 Tax=Kribbella amoyensis TaxID=996641 RepID=A0A561BLT6_9ACTN|nr:endonuclease/exonuclease/phosphatase family protein [Kribbella amoyensis]TWD79787.1 endonuclease/exonuclease/phosphatase family metal-dependent hydrolase [Kribbella amoyensis]